MSKKVEEALITDVLQITSDAKLLRAALDKRSKHIAGEHLAGEQYEQMVAAGAIVIEE